jgi:hypothetical protein
MNPNMAPAPQTFSTIYIIPKNMSKKRKRKHG